MSVKKANLFEPPQFPQVRKIPRNPVLRGQFSLGAVVCQIVSVSCHAVSVRSSARVGVCGLMGAWLL